LIIFVIKAMALGGIYLFPEKCKPLLTSMGAIFRVPRFGQRVFWKICDGRLMGKEGLLDKDLQATLFRKVTWWG